MNSCACCQRRQYQGGDRELKEAVTNISTTCAPRSPPSAAILSCWSKSPKAPRPRGISALHSGAGAGHEAAHGGASARYSVAASPAQPLPLEPVELNRALEQSVAGFYAPLKARGVAPGHPHACAAGGPPPQRRGGGPHFFGNLLSNALKYSGGDLEIPSPPPARSRFSQHRPGLDGQVGRLFDRFFTVETAHSSTGLGLSIARALTGAAGRFHHRPLPGAHPQHLCEPAGPRGLTACDL